MEKESEKKVEQYLKMLAERQGWLCLKNRPYEIGYPDRLIVLPGGKVAWAELKTTGEKPRPMQIRRINQLTAMDHIAEVLDSKRKVEQFINKLKEYGQEE